MNGILLIDKPEGWTSMDVCAKLRGALGEKKIGHSGTLDPMATGLLPVFLGRATRAVEFAEADEKTYLASLRLGLETDTQDITGTVLRESALRPSAAEIEAILPRFRGEIEQIPPMYSAVKIGGKKLYQLARKGREIERPARRVTIHELEVLGGAAGEYRLRIRCSKGTYIRTLCHDIGAALGCGGCMSALRRSAAGRFSLDAAHTLDAVLAAAQEGRAETLLLPVDALFAQLAPFALTHAQEKAVRNGGRFTCVAAPGQYRLYGADEVFLALGESSEGCMKTVKSFFEV